MNEDMAVIQSLRCFNCWRFAYHDLFMGNHGASGYLCRACLKQMQGAFK